ncbi:formate/nitrite transporter family protein [Modestobacter sp. VKM Ac-2984]|uniref:formate/nitrite transporter family protein n=1 Tax=Modestobacter sp. VKM Ac-2984 TaxID=3004138 RepID=UPI0022AB2D74|nr:formate/nitrite transporter family protein [Modestobacter sp. VKM Ac-2984]MCZ2815053.1 formate/nitrite transporter family protein [Modestobacter sp. VKM Ac-2984]
MAVAPDPDEIYERARKEGHRRLYMPPLEQVSTGFIAGVTIVFGIVALGVIVALLDSAMGERPAEVVGAVGFSFGVVFLIVGRTELFSENFFDPVAAAIEEGGVRVWVRMVRLWGTILLLNLVGGAALVGVMTVEGALPGDADQVLVHLAEATASLGWAPTLARAVLAGALVTLLSYMLKAVNSVSARILVSAMVGFFLALGPFDHAAVSGLQILFGVWLSDAVTYVDLFRNVGLATAGNLAGGLLLITLTHTAQVKSSR